MVYHDIGKPACRTVDENGRVHYPNHAQVSADLRREMAGDGPIARLIERDMEIHTMGADGAPHFLRDGAPMAATLLLVGIAEVLANAEMFGGRKSPSFLAKIDRISRRGKSIVSLCIPVMHEHTKR